MRLSSTSHSPSLLPSPPPHLPPAAAAAALRRARTPQCKDCSSITFGARQGLANFSDGYIVQLDSLLAQASPHVSNSALPLMSAAAAPLSLSWSQPPTPSPSHSASGSEAAGSSLLTGTPAAASSSDMLAWLVATLAGQPQTPSATMGERVFIGNGLPALPKKLLTKIRNWEYVELADLLPAPHSAGDPYGNGPPAARFPLFPGCEVVRHKRRQITSISQWTQALTIYTAALVSVHPSATLELLAYMLTIIRASQQYDGLCWRSYDTNYRIAAAASGNRSWSKLDTDLFTRFFTGRARTVNPCTVCDALTHTSNRLPRSTCPTEKGRNQTGHWTSPETEAPIR